MRHIRRAFLYINDNGKLRTHFSSIKTCIYKPLRDVDYFYCCHVTIHFKYFRAHFHADMITNTQIFINLYSHNSIFSVILPVLFHCASINY